MVSKSFKALIFLVFIVFTFLSFNSLTTSIPVSLFQLVYNYENVRITIYDDDDIIKLILLI